MLVDGAAAGVVGEIAPDVVAALGLGGPVVGFELDLGVMFGGERRAAQMGDVSRYPASGVDLAFVVDADVPAAEIAATLRAAAGELLEEIHLFDVFRSEALGGERVSLAFALRFRAADRTLTDEEVAGMRQRCIDAVERSHHAELRG